MPLGTNYDWGSTMGGYEDALSQLYGGQQTDFLDFLRSFAPQLMQFLQQRKLEGLGQQQRVGGILEAGEGVVLPKDINMMGQAAPEMMPWEQLRSLVGTDPSPFPAGPMSISKEAQRDLPPLFARSPYNEMMRQLDMEYKIAQLRPKAKEKTDIYGKLPGWMRHATPEQKEAYIRKQIAMSERGGPEAKEWQVEREEFKEGYKILNPEATEDDISKAWFKQIFEKAEKADRTLSQTIPPDINMFGDFIPPGPAFNMYRIRQTERLGIKTDNKATMEEARKARIMKGYPPLEDERDMQKAIRNGAFGKTKKEILANLKTMDYPDDYIEFIMAELGIK